MSDMARLKVKMNQLEQAEAIANKMIDLFPRNWQGYYALMETYSH